jgi:hypothetical protein
MPDEFNGLVPQELRKIVNFIINFRRIQLSYIADEFLYGSWEHKIKRKFFDDFLMNSILTLLRASQGYII